MTVSVRSVVLTPGVILSQLRPHSFDLMLRTSLLKQALIVRATIT